MVLRERRCVDKEVGPLSLSGSFRFGCVGDKERRKALLEGKAAPTSAREDVETEAAAPGQKGAGSVWSDASPAKRKMRGVAMGAAAALMLRQARASAPRGRYPAGHLFLVL